MSYLKKLLLPLIMALGLGTVPVLAQDQVCDREGLKACFGFQIINAKHTDRLEAAVRANPSNAGPDVLSKIERGIEKFYGEQAGGKLFIWLRPEVASDPNFVVPKDLMREFHYSDSSPNPQVGTVHFETHPKSFPKLNDPRLPKLGPPHYVLVNVGGTGGLGWSIPKSFLAKIAYVVYCPDGETSYPDRRAGKSLGLHFPPEEIAAWIAHRWDYVQAAVLRIR